MLPPSEGGKAPADGAVAGPGGPALGSCCQPGGGTREFYTQDTISEDGSRVFFSDAGTGQIYVRENDALTVRVSASRRSEPENPAETKPAYWRAATPNGRYVFFTSEEKLTNDATAAAGRPDLYRFDVASEELEDLTTGAPAGADVLGTLGVSDDGSYVYFVAPAKLAEGATETPEQTNLYEWHEGVTTFITKLRSESSQTTPGDSADWRDYYSNNGSGSGKSSRVTPDGTKVLFARGSDPQGSGLELYSLSGGLTLLAGDAFLQHPDLQGIGGINGRDEFLTHNLSENGDRVFFQTDEKFVPQDENGTVEDVYEWEREGEGTCESNEQNLQGESTGGCYYLISSGQSKSASYFGDASANGDDVFFFTRQSLVRQDQDENADIYDARVDGGIAAQNPPPAPVPCAGEEACRGTAGPAPVFTAPTTVTFSGLGSLTSPPSGNGSRRGEPKPLTRAQKLDKALKACGKHKRGKRRRACEHKARKIYGTKHKNGGKAEKSRRGGK